MSISTEITRVQGLRNALRTKLSAMLGISPAADLEDCVAAVDGIADKGAVTGSINTKSGQYTVPQGYHNGGGKVGIATAEQDKLTPANIRQGVTVLGVEGTCEGLDAQTKSATPTKTQQTIKPDDGYNALSEVVVAPIPGQYQDVSDVTATAADTLANKLIVTADGRLTPGTMPNNGAIARTIDGLTATSVSIPEGYTSGGTVTLTGEIEAALAAI